nr:MAG TPA: hypothetical protein [Caudoviricetes sp.]
MSTIRCGTCIIQCVYRTNQILIYIHSFIILSFFLFLYSF